MLRVCVCVCGVLYSTTRIKKKQKGAGAAVMYTRGVQAEECLLCADSSPSVSQETGISPLVTT